MYDREPGGPIFNYAFSATAISSAATSGYDLWCVTAPSNSRLAVREIRIGQYSEFADAQSELLSIILLSGSTSVSSGGPALTGVNLQRYSGAATANSSVTGPSTTLASTASAALLLADSFNVARGWRFRPQRVNERPVLGLSQRLLVRMGGANDAMTLNGTLSLQELGQTPQ